LYPWKNCTTHSIRM